MANMKVALIANVVGGGGAVYLSSNDKSLSPSQMMECQFDKAPYKAVGGELLYATSYFSHGEAQSMIIDHRLSGIDIGAERGNEIYYSVTSVPEGWKFDGWYTIPAEGFTPRHTHDGVLMEYEYDPDQYTLKVSGEDVFTMNDAFGAGSMDAAYTREVEAYPGSSTRYVTARFVEAVEITYHPGVHGGEPQVRDAVAKGADATLRGATFTRAGYTQTGWAMEDGGEKVYDLSQTIPAPASNLDLYPVWKAKLYPLSLVFSEGIAEISVAYTSGGMNISDEFHETTTVDADYGSGYGATAVAAAGHTVTGEATVRGVIGEGGATFAPKATLNSYTVTFDANGGRIALTPSTSALTYERTMYYGAVYSWFPTAYRKGYAFVGWFTAADGGEQVYTTSTFANEGPLTLYAHWAANQYTVTFNANGGSTPVPSKRVSYGAEYGALPVPVKAGYRFAGWYTELSGGTHVTATDVFLGTEAQALYAHWAASSTPLVFDANGGGGAMTTGRIAVLGQPMPTGIALPSFLGHEFLGFYDAAQGGTMYYAPSGASARVWDKTTDSPVTLYAHWRVLVLAISFDANGATISAESQLRVVMAGVQIGELPVPLPFEGRTFVGWFHGEEKISSSSTFSADTVCVARWTHSISVDGAMQTVGLDDTITLNAPENRTGYTFGGYAIDVDVKVDGDVVTAGTPIPVGTTISLIEDAVATSIWTGNIYRVTYSPNGGDPIDASIYSDVIYGEPYGTIALTKVSPTRGGYVCEGWTRMATADGEDAIILDPGTVVDVARDHTLYAWWREGEAAVIKFDPNGGTFGLQGCKTYRAKMPGEAYGELPTPLKERHNFVGWYKGSTRVTSGTEVAEGETEIVLTAQWEESSSYWYQVQMHRNSGSFPDPVSDPTDYPNWSVISLQEYLGMTASDHLMQGTPYTLPTVAELGWQRHGYSLDVWKDIYAQEEFPNDEDEVEDGATIRRNAGRNGSAFMDNGLVAYKAQWGRHENIVKFLLVDSVNGTVVEDDVAVADFVSVKITAASSSYDDHPDPGNDEYTEGSALDLTFYADPEVEFTPIPAVDGIGTLVSVKGSSGTVSTGRPWEVSMDAPRAYLLLYTRDDVEIAVDYAVGNGARGAVYCSAGESISGDGRSVSVSMYGVVHVAARPKQGYRFDGWFLDAEGTEPFDGAAEFTMLATESLTLYARFERNPSYIYRWEGEDRNMLATWRSKTYVGSKPFNAVACRVDALGYVGDGTELRLKVDSFSSPDAAATSSVTLEDIETQRVRRLPARRPERYHQIEVESDVEVDAIFVGTSMEGVAV